MELAESVPIGFYVFLVVCVLMYLPQGEMGWSTIWDCSILVKLTCIGRIYYTHANKKKATPIIHLLLKITTNMNIL